MTTNTARTTLTWLVALSVMTAARPALAQYNNRFGVAAFNWDGSHYNGFDSDGRVSNPFPPGIGAWPHGMVGIPGRIIVVGGDYYGRFALAAYRQATGDPDLTWGAGGLVQTSFSGAHAEAYAAALAGNGDLVVVGSAIHSADSGQSRFAIARYDSFGTELWKIQTSFPRAEGGTTRCGGTLPTSSYFNTSDRGIIPNGDAARAVAIDAGGRIVVAGYSRTAQDGRIALARYDANGNLDPTFDGDGDTDGLILTNVGPITNALYPDCEQANGLAFLGKDIVVVGSRLVTTGPVCA
jgi:serralysin